MKKKRFGVEQIVGLLKQDLTEVVFHVEYYLDDRMGGAACAVCIICHAVSLF